jgi:hypothetical protein
MIQNGWMMIWAEHARWGKRKVYIFLAGEADGKRPPGSHRSRWENVIIDLKGLEENWVDLSGS